jgi:hypothetical protein
MAAVVTKFTLGSSYTLKISHLEGEEVFGSTKQRQDLPLGLKGDLHKHDGVNFFYPQVEFILRNFTPNVDVG